MPENPANHAAHQLTTRECEELDVWSSEVGWETDYHQVGRGGFDAWFDMSLCNELMVVDQFCDRELSATGVPPRGYIPLILPMNRGDRGVFQGKVLAPNEVAIVCPDSRATYRTPANLRMFTLHLPETRIRSALRAMQQEPDELIGETRLIKLTDEVCRRLAWIGRQVIETCSMIAAPSASAIYQRELEEHFVTALMWGLTGLDEQARGVLGRQNRVKYVTAARDYIESHLDAPLGLETLARAIDVSPRTLEYAFREVFDITPLRYIKVRRLNAARRRLLAAEDSQQTVTDVALDYGFNHFSYFAKDYHTLFGEYPSQTLNAASVGAGNRV